MKSKGILVVVGLVVVGAAWYAFRPERLFVSQKVNENFPAAQTQAAEKKTTEPVALASGHFHSVAHESAGVATVYQLPDGKRVLRLTEFKTSNGPDVQLYLVASDDAKDNDTVKKVGFMTLGALKGNEGDQNYDVPSDVDLTKYRAVTVWCRRFGVNFATAPLARQGS